MIHSRPFLPTLALISALAFTASAGDIYVPDNNVASGACNHFPFDPNWSGANGSYRYQLVIPANLLGGKACGITDVAFASCVTVTFNATQFEVRISHTTVTNPGTTFANNLTNPQVVVPAGPVSWSRTAGVWNPLALVQPFFYNGTDNLTIEIRYDGGSLTGGSSSSDRQTSNLALNYVRLWRYGTGSYTNPTASGWDQRGLKVRLTCADAFIFGGGTPRPGGTVNLGLRAGNDPGLPYQVGTSLGTGPIPLGARQLNLSPDTLLVVSVGGHLPTVFQNYSGVLSATGQGLAKIVIPGVSALVGVRLYSAFVTIKAGAPFNLKSISTTYGFTITR